MCFWFLLQHSSSESSVAEPLYAVDRWSHTGTRESMLRLSSLWEYGVFKFLQKLTYIRIM
jgi:hypothetical protein